MIMATIKTFEEIDAWKKVLDRKYIEQKKFDELYALAEKIGKMLGGWISYLNKSNIKGTKFKNRVI
jgi:hypothetical protein